MKADTSARLPCLWTNSPTESSVGRGNLTTPAVCYMASFSWCLSRVLPLTATLLLTLLAAHWMLILPEENPLDDCYHVYLDMGTNTGVQVMLNISIIVRFCIPLNRSENYTSRTCFLKLKFSQCLTNSLDPHLKGTLETFTFFSLQFS